MSPSSFTSGDVHARRGSRHWPGADSPWHGRYPIAARRRFFRRLAVVAVGVLLLGVSGVLALTWLAATTFGIVAPLPRLAALVVLIGGTGGAMMAVVALIAMMRRVWHPLRAVMDAADSVAGGDYATRVDERGPMPMRALARSFNTMTERLQNNDRLRRNLMADVAHELRTPLTVMQGRLEGLLDGVYSLDDRQVTELLDETRVLNRLVEDLRTLALSEAGALRLEREPTDVVSLARDVAQAFSADAQSRGVSLDVQAAVELPPLSIDPVRIREVLTNLVSNALRYTPPGGSVRVRVAAAPAGGAMVQVSDTGRGMTPDQLAHAFDRFHKEPSSRGSGLGLTIARGLVVGHGGEIHAASDPGVGTTITFTLPSVVA